MTYLRRKGFTLIELMITLVILGIIITISSASYQSLLADQALYHGVHQVYYTLQLAKIEAVKRNQKIYAQFCKQKNIWKMGVSQSSGCDCFSASSCQLDGINTVKTLTDGNNLFIEDSDIKFTNLQASFGPLRFSVETGSVTFTTIDKKRLSVIQSAMRLRVCGPDQAYLGYKKC